MRIGLANASTLVKDPDVVHMAAAIAQQLNEDVLPLWNRAQSDCIFVPGGLAAAPPPDVILLMLLDTVDVANALGYHDELPDGTIYGKIAVKPVLDAGGGILTAGSSGDSVSAVVSHEAIEAKGDPNCSLWADGPLTFSGVSYASVALELCDPVQAGAYDKSGVLVSDFVGPSWIDRENLHAADRSPYNWLRTLKAPLSVDKGGYLIVRDAPGSETQVFGEGGNARPWRVGCRRFSRGLKP